MSPPAALVQPVKYSAKYAGDMAYVVDLTVRAARDLDYLYQQIDAAESVSAARWFNRLEEAISTLWAMDEANLNQP